VSEQPDTASANKKADEPEPARNGLISDETPLLEWIVAAVGLVLVVSTIGFTFYRAWRETETPPAVTVTVETIVAQDAGYLVTFRALNEGEGTAAAVTVEGVLLQNGEEIELSTASLDFVPSRSERQGGLFFTEDPEQYELQLRATGYADP
jgi:uncharacterized protein (TIGR02588 family)